MKDGTQEDWNLIAGEVKDHPCYEHTKEFIEKYDAPAFDPDLETYPLEFFEPMVRRVFAKPRKSLYSFLQEA